MNRKTIKNWGFSLIELIIAIAILVILTGLLAPQFMKYIDSARRAKIMHVLQNVDEAVQVGFIEATEKTKGYEDVNSIVIKFGEVREENSTQIALNLLESLKHSLDTSILKKVKIEIFSALQGSEFGELEGTKNILIKYYPDYPDETFYFYAKGHGKVIPVPLEDATFGKGYGDGIKDIYVEKWQ